MFRSRYFASAATRLFQRFGHVKFPTRRRIAYTGVATSIAASLFSNSSDLKKNAAMETMSKIQEADAYYKYYMIDNAYAVLRRFRKSEDPEVLWRLGRVITEQGKMCKNVEEKKRLFEEALEILKKALSNADSCVDAHKWYAITLDCYANEFQGTKQRLEDAQEVKNHLERALELNSKDPALWMAIGIWHFTFADMSSYTRLATRAFYANPPSSTYEEALDKFQKAELLQPNFCSSNMFYIGQIYERQGRKDQAKEQYLKAFAAPIFTADDHDIHMKANERLKKLGAKSEMLGKST